MGKRIRILYTIPNFNTAGSGKVLYDLVNHIDKDKFEIEIACENSDGYLFETIESLGVPIRIFKTKTTYRPYSSLLFRIVTISRFYRTHHYDIVHSWQWSSDWTEALAAKLASTKWIYTKKAMGFDNKHWHIKTFLADFIVTINDEMHHYFPWKRRQSLIPLGIDTEYYNPKQFKVNNRLDDSEFHIITVANLVPVKGIEILIEAILMLNDTNIKLTVLGDNDSDYGHMMMALIEDLKIQGQIQFLGKKLDVRPFIAASDLYVIPTLNEGRKEGMPMALVEAMSMATPVLGSDISGINFVLKDFKELLFQAGNAEHLAEKIQGIQKNSVEKRQVIGEKLRVYCVSNFSIESFIKAHERLYSEIV
ncbi:glycosyltransferase [uncultured Gelidibacter sp.]|uniref:glycosyltransferase n=1 Tax=uncultured Gelidibacter sp. TaxID=259318 RepID=UPI00262FCD15|nr:glycosyltransferase [uncultured Gelidibacter sp.]